MIYITGDLHREIDISKLNTKNFPEQKKLNKDDYVVICGDFGCVWDDSNTDKYWIKWLENKSFTTLFVDGNHENFNLLAQFPTVEKFEGEVGKIGSSIFHLRRGQIYKIGNKKFFTFGGAKSIDIEYRLKDISWWEQEIPSLEEMERGLENLYKVNYAVDVVITHTCPTSIFNFIMDGAKKITVVEEYLEKVRVQLDNNGIDYRWYFGHFHQDVMTDNKFHCLYESILELK